MEEVTSLGEALYGASWSPEKSTMLIASMDTSKQGSVSEADFVDHFTRLLAESPEILAGLPKIRAAAGRVWRD